MTDFTLHEKLSNDCIELGMLQDSLLLLMNNSLVPWFIIVPKTSKLELYELSEREQAALHQNINLLSEFMVNNFRIDKLNVASIGNIVNQMHIHVIGRQREDYCWPDVVWGKKERVAYEPDQVSNLVDALTKSLLQHFKPGG